MLSKGDPTRFTERGFVVLENKGQSLRLIDRDNAEHAISIRWDDLSALREIITLALEDGPMVIGNDRSSGDYARGYTEGRAKGRVEGMERAAQIADEVQEKMRRNSTYNVAYADGARKCCVEIRAEAVRPTVQSKSVLKRRENTLKEGQAHNDRDSC
jgi:hypothetical protein